MEVSVTFGSGMVAPGGETTVTVQVSPPLAGWEVSWSSSVSGQDPSCGVPVGVFGATFGVTGAGGTFTTSYKAGLDVGSEVISAHLLNGPLNSSPNSAAASLVVRGACGNRADRIAYEYDLKGVTFRPGCGMFATSGEFLRFGWNAWNGGSTTGNPHANWGLPEQISAKVQQVESYFGFEFDQIWAGYRSPCGNANVDGHPQSLHMQGRAADLRIPAAVNSDTLRAQVISFVTGMPGGYSYQYSPTSLHFQWQ